MEINLPEIDQLFQNAMEAVQQGKARESIDLFSRTIECLEALSTEVDSQEKQLPEWRNTLVRGYNGRGVAFAGLGDHQAALENFERATVLGEDLREDSESKGEWPLEWQTVLAKAYGNLGITLQGSQDYAGAMAAYDAAISLREGVREILGERWTREMQNDLAGAYINRGHALHHQQDYPGAAAAYDTAIALGEALRAALEPTGKWPPEWQNILATGHRNLGIALQGSQDYSGAVASYEEAIVLWEELRKAPGERWSHEMQNDLAGTYMNRSDVLSLQQDYTGAVASYDAAIALGEELRDALGERWTHGMQNSLARSYMHRGLILDALGQRQDALKNYDAAIALDESLRDTLQPKGVLNAQKTPPTTIRLSKVNRGFQAAIKYFKAFWLLHRALRAYKHNKLKESIETLNRAIPLAEDVHQIMTRRNVNKLTWTSWQYEMVRAYSIRGHILHEQGDLQAGLQNVEHAIELGEVLLRKGIGLPAWWNDLARTYMHRGLVLDALGRHQDAIKDYDTAIALDESLRDTLQPKGDLNTQQTPPTTTRLTKVRRWFQDRRKPFEALWLHQKALRACRQNKLKKGIETFDQAILLAEATYQNMATKMAFSRYTWEWQSELVRIYGNRSFFHYKQGDLVEGLQDIEHAIEIGNALRQKVEPMGKWRPLWQQHLAWAYGTRSIMFHDLGNREVARKDLEHAIEIGEALRQTLTPKRKWKPEWQCILASSYANRSLLTCFNKGDLQAALKDSEAAIKIMERLRGTLTTRRKWQPEWQQQIAQCYKLHGRVLQALGQSDKQAILEDYARAISLGEDIRRMLEPKNQWRYDWQINLASTYIEHGDLLGLDDPKAAAENYECATCIVDNIPDLVVHDKTGLVFMLAARAASLIDPSTDQDAEFKGFSDELVESLAHSLFPPSSRTGADLRRNFAQFHALWILHCLQRGTLETIPQILNVLQGRHLAQAVRDELLMLEEGVGLPDDVKTYRNTLLELRKLQANIQAVLPGGLDTSSATGKDRLGLIPPARMHRHQPNTGHLEAEVSKLKRKLQQTLDAAATHPGYAYLKPPVWEASSAQILRERLRRREAMLILIELSHLLALNRTQTQKTRHTALALIIYPERPWQTFELQGLDQLTEETQALASSQTRGYRRAHLADVKPQIVPCDEQDEIDFWSRLEREMTKTLWHPLREALEGVEQLVVLAHGALHQLPLPAGKPEGLDLVFYPSLPFFLERRDPNAFPPLMDDGSCLIRGFAGANGDIPMTAAETAMISGLWQEAREASSVDLMERETTPRILHLASHGVPDGRRPLRSWRIPDEETFPTALQIDHGDYALWGEPEIEQSRSIFPTVYLSACIGGQLVEDLDGTPSGLITKLFLHRRTRVAIASLVNIPDRWAAVLGFLFHQVMQREGLPPERALRQAIERLIRGEWFEDTAASIEAEFMPILSGMMETSLRGFEENYRGHRLEVFLRLPAERERRELLAALWNRTPAEAEQQLAVWTDEHGLSTECGGKLRKQLAPFIDGSPSTKDSERFLRTTPADEGLGRAQREVLLDAWTPWESQLFKKRAALASLPEEEWSRRSSSLEEADRETWRERFSGLYSEILRNRIPPQPHLGTLRYGMRAFGEQ